MFDYIIFWVQREYEEFKVRINGLVSMAQKVPEEGWTMQDGTPWPGNNVRNHPGLIQVMTYLSILQELSSLGCYGTLLELNRFCKMYHECDILCRIGKSF